MEFSEYIEALIDAAIEAEQDEAYFDALASEQDSNDYDGYFAAAYGI